MRRANRDAHLLSPPMRLMKSRSGTSRSLCSAAYRNTRDHLLRVRPSTLPGFYFHLSAGDQDFQDNIGSDVSDLAAAHCRAVRLADRVMMFSCFADCAPDFQR